MTLPAGSRWGVRLLSLLAAMIVSLGVATAAHAAAPSLLGSQKIDEENGAVSCSSASYCVTGGLDLVVQDHAVRSDLTTKLVGENGELSAISCAPGTTFCALMDDSGGAYTMSNGTVSSRTPLTTNGFDAVSCASTTFCIAIDELGNTYVYAGSTWVLQAGQRGTLTSGLTGLQVSCPSTGFCVAAVPAGGASPDEDYFTLNGSIWTAKGAMESTGATASGLSCTSTTFCIATDTQGFALRFNGTTWTPTALLDNAGVGTDEQVRVSCSGTFCLASSTQAANIYTTTDGSSWSLPTSLKSGGFGAGGPTSCASSTMCVIVDSEGNGYTYALPDTANSPVLTGSPAVGAAITLTPGTPASPDASVADTFQRCGVDSTCTTLPGTSYTTTAADVGATFKASQTSGVGLDIEGPVTSNTIGPIAKPSTGGGGGGATTKPPVATVGATSSSGTNATVAVSCPADSSASCQVAVNLTVTETLSGKKLIAVTARKHKTTKRTVVVGAASATIAAGAHRTLTVSLNRAGKKLLSSRHRLKVQLSVIESGKTLATKKVGFTAPKKKKHKRK